MLQWTLVDTADIPGGGELQLHQRGREFAIRVAPNAELMNSGASGSEKALAELGFDRLGAHPSPCVLVGGLGMGFTTAAALRRLPPDGRLVVAELIPAVVDWNRGPLGELAGHPLADPRVAVRVADVGEILRTTTSGLDLVLLDVDNGPNAMTTPTNAWLYQREGLAACARALKPGGILAVWSAVTDQAFTQRLRQGGWLADVVEVRAHGRRGRRHWIWFARRATRAEHEAHRRQRVAKRVERLARRGRR